MTLNQNINEAGLYINSLFQLLSASHGVPLTNEVTMPSKPTVLV